MKTNDVKGLILVISGIITAFFPSIISRLFYLVGIIIILFCVVKIVKTFLADSNPTSIILNVMGVIAGGIITSLPSFVQIIIPLTVGLILTASGLDFATKSVLSHDKRIFNAVIALILTVLGVMLMFNLVKAGSAIRITAGIIMVIAGAYDFFISRNSYKSDGIIDIENYTVSDDKKYLK
ncbi:MAG: hypothetical protein K2J08_08820 [Ruminococcus sp.]|nr:hypothetical protein [Ruminococcus sp.]